MAKALHVANYLIYLRDMDEKNGQYYSLTNLKLQKLLYYCQGGHYKWDDEQLIDDDEMVLFEAWDYGPVLPEIYFTFKNFGQNDINNDNLIFDLNDAQKETIEAVWKQLRNKTAFQLVEHTHSEKPWQDAINQRKMFIRENEIREFFNKKEEVTT